MVLYAGPEAATAIKACYYPTRSCGVESAEKYCDKSNDIYFPANCVGCRSEIVAVC